MRSKGTHENSAVKRLDDGVVETKPGGEVDCELVTQHLFLLRREKHIPVLESFPVGGRRGNERHSADTIAEVESPACAPGHRSRLATNVD